MTNYNNKGFFKRDAVGELLERFPKNRLYNGLKSVVVRKSRIPKIDCFAVGEPLARFPKIVYTMG